MLHEVIARDHGVGVSLASILLDAGARTDVRDEFLKSTPLGWACRWGRVELVNCCWLEGPIRSSPGPSRGPHRSRGPNGVNMRGLHRSSGNTELTDSCTLSVTRQGQRLCARITDDLVDQQKRLLQDLDPQVRGGVVQVLRHLAQAADARFRSGVASEAGATCCAPGDPASSCD